MALLGVLRAVFLPATWRMAWRNVGRNPRRTGIVVSAIAVGLGATILAMAFNYGMIFQMVAAAIDIELGHVQVHARGFEQKPGIEHVFEPGANDGAERLGGLTTLAAWAPRIRHEGLVSSPRASVGVRVVAVDPAREAAVSTIHDAVFEGEFLDGDRRRVVMGERMAERLAVAVGDKVVLSLQDTGGDLTGEAYRVGGLFRTSSRELDETAIYLHIEEARRLIALGSAISEWALRAEDENDVELLADALEAGVASALEVRTWRQLRPFLVSMIDAMDQMGWVMYAAVFIAMAFGIANVLLMSLFERIREIGIMMSLGMPPARLIATLLVESLILTIVGVGSGIALGLLGIAALGDGIDLSRWGEGLVAYGIPTKIIPVLRERDLVQPIVIAVITALFASLWPAVRAARIRPAEAVRHV